MAFNPQQQQQAASERLHELEEIEGDAIALDTLKEVCASQDGDAELESDVVAVYKTAEQIERDALGSGSGQNGRVAVNSLVSTQGNALFEALLAEEQGKEDSTHG